MKIEIYYCRPWGFKDKAVSLADELHKAYNVNAELIAGTDGIFDVVIEGQKVFSRSETGRFPEPGEIAEKLRYS